MSVLGFFQGELMPDSDGSGREAVPCVIVARLGGPLPRAAQSPSRLRFTSWDWGVADTKKPASGEAGFAGRSTLQRVGLKARR
ncbi:hypothetical protein C7T35_06900 [Variovorax sp. WS11]|nr:hypothetical protein C7T35_06900 [Variovorax sp. WS11]